MRLLALGMLRIVVVLLSGCATATPLPTGLMLGYTAQWEAVPSLHVVVYSADRPTCEILRARNLKDKSSEECRRVTVEAGTDYWAFAYPEQGAIGTNDREWCLKLREAVAQYRGGLGQCQPIAVKDAQ
jgi:hypothetical protein